MVRRHVTLTKEDRENLESLISKGTLSAKKFKRATGLLELDRSKSLTAVAATLGVTYATVATWRNNYKKQGIKCLEDAPRSGRPVGLNGDQRAKITALACSKPPEGHSQWSLRLLADKVIELEYVDRISFKYVGTILKKTI